MEADVIAGLLAERDRLAVFAAVVLGATVPSQIAERTGLGEREIGAAVRRLQGGGLLTTDGGRLAARTEAFREAVRQRPVTAAGDDDTAGLQPDVAAVLRAFVRGGRITQLPAMRRKRRILLEHVVTVFEPGVRYPEREVDALLRAWHDDHAALRRYLVDECLLSREANVYWRTGGPVDTLPPPQP